MKNLFICENGFDKEKIPFYGNKFLCGNGYMGVRGTLSEYGKEQLACINLAGVYDQVGNDWRESVNAPNALYSYVTVDGKKLALPETAPEVHEMKLDICKGILHRHTVFATEKGTVTLNVMRAVSMANSNLLLESVSVTTDFDSKISFICGIDGDVWDIHGPHFISVTPDVSEQWLSVSAITGEKKTEVVSRLKIEHNGESEKYTDKTSAYEKISFDATAGAEYTVKKVATVHTSEDKHEKKAPGCFDDELSAHVNAWNTIVDDSYIEIDGDDQAELALNYSIYHLNAIAPRHSKSMSIAARGLSGQVYKGAIFWDTEMFMLDYFLYTYPEIARTLLSYRIDSLPGAKEKAASYGFDGAFYAWESQEGGFDACSDYNIVDVFTKRPVRTFFRDKQVHISSAIVYAFDKYVTITGDTSFLKEGGAKVILECAKFYRSLLLRRYGHDVYEIWDVIGPDEYHERVNNNAYTNRMAKMVFDTVTKYADMFDEDVSEFSELAAKIYVPSPNSDGLVEQFDGYFALENCSIDDVRSRLLDPKEYWGGANGVASHTQILKQADVVAMMSMFSDDYPIEIMKKNLEYYAPRTEHGSSLSACMYSLLACYTQNPDFAYPFFMKSAAADLNPGCKQWIGLVYIGGTHPASEGGAWMVAVKGFAGLKIENGKISCNPNMPSSWNGMKFKIYYNGKRHSIVIDKNGWKIENS